MKPQDLNECDWKYLIVLDACRCDMLQKVSDLYVQGVVVPRLSPASFTLKWLIESFPGEYDDLCYVSPIPYCNSRKKINHKGLVFSGYSHFYRVFDAWNDCWSSEFRTVLPDLLVEYSLRRIAKYSDKRFVVHFMQPHAPYLCLDPLGESPSSIGDLDDKDFVVDNLWYRGRMFVADMVFRTLGMEFLWKMRRWLHHSSEQLFERHYWQVDGDGERLRKAYMMNLCLVLQQVKRLIKRLPDGEVVITADHGELLGEKGYWGHGIPKPLLPELVTVPWLEINR